MKKACIRSSFSRPWKARRVAFVDCKKAKVIRDLAVLRASNPVVPMVSAFDLEDEGAAAPEREEERDEDEHDCTERCKRQKTRLKGLVSDLNKQVDALSSALQEVTRRCKRLIRRPSAHQTQQVKDVTTKLLKALEDPAEEDAATPAVTSPPRSPESGPSTSRATEAEHLGERSPAHFPDHVAVLNELLESYRRHQEGPAPSRKLKENVSGKVFRIRSFVAHMAEGQGRLQTLAFLDDPERIRRWVGNLGRSKITATTVNHYLKNVAQFLDFLAETPPKTCRLSKNAMTRVRREVRMLLRSMKRPVTMHQMEVKEVKEGQLISKQVLRRCNAEAKKAIPRILDKLEKDLCQKTQFVF
ncbi:uncharacterized protein [Misgurnus anguillicaudatus]|uniref:uncharacterized protein n=1 Tax=Misgurnus anguillicaudatus TaxID=75329 RepID=UPI003CCF7C90